MLQSKISSISKKEVIPIIVLLFAVLLLFVRSFFSFSWYDESFYLSMVNRLFIGEKMFVDEWYTTQLCAPLMLPFYSAFVNLTGSTDSIYLFFRLLYLVISAATAIFSYFCLIKRFSKSSSLICSLMYLFYSRANIGGLSYYNMTLTFVLIACLLLGSLNVHEEITRKEKVDTFLAGIALALAIVNTPYLAIPYVLIAICILFNLKKGGNYGKVLLYCVCGSALVGICYLCYVLSNVTINEIIVNIPHILNEPELQKTNPVLAVPMILIRIAWRFKYTIIPICILALFVILKEYNMLLATYYNKKSINLFFKCLNVLLFVFNLWLSKDMIGCVYIALFLYVLPYMLSGDFKMKREDSSICRLLLGGGISISIAFSFSSDTGLDAVCIGFVLIGMASTLFIMNIEGELIDKISLLSSFMVVIACLLLSAFLRMFSVYRDAPISQLKTKIECGPAKGLYTTAQNEEKYTQLYEDINNNIAENETVLYSQIGFWCYLCKDNRYATPSCWRMPINSTRLEEYFTSETGNGSLRKMPTCVFVINEDYGAYESSFILNNEKTETPNFNELSGYLFDYIVSSDYEKVELTSGVIYRTKN